MSPTITFSHDTTISLSSKYITLLQLSNTIKSVHRFLVSMQSLELFLIKICSDRHFHMWFIGHIVSFSNKGMQKKNIMYHQFIVLNERYSTGNVENAFMTLNPK